MEMWGDPEVSKVFSEICDVLPIVGYLTDTFRLQSAAQLVESDELVSLLLQVSGPAHVHLHDSRWQELLMGYDVWVHIEETRQPGDIVSAACTSMAKHAPHSSNLAALALHVSRMIRDLQIQSKAVDFTDRIAVVGKARATAGSLNLLRVLIHDISPDLLRDALSYRSRDTDRVVADRLAGAELVTCLLNYLSSISSTELQMPALYDATVICLQLLIILLSTQLYQPMISSMERKHGSSTNCCHYVLDYIMEEARRRRQHKHRLDTTNETSVTWSPKTVLKACLEWQLHRPSAPPQSIAHHCYQLVESVIAAKGDKVGPDGMYETHVVVIAEKPQAQNDLRTEQGSASAATAVTRRSTSSNIFLDATKGVLVFSSSLILLPFRLMSLALRLLRVRGGPEYDQLKKQHIKLATQNRRTNDVLWLSKSPIADLSTSLLLILVHNCRASNNPFRAELAELNDNRWDETTDIVSATNSDFEDRQAINPLLHSNQVMTTNFESLFESFGSIAHTEVGALLLYTMYQSSPTFAASMAVRSDLDTLVVPLLRTLYFSSSLRYYSGSTARQSNSSGNSSLSLWNCPFRSLSQLYLNLIIVLLFSQDASFGPDAFRRVIVTSVPWYRERNLKDINLGSLLMLTILRSISFNLNRLQDAFLLSNCCAVLMNLSPNVVELHDYAAMRLANVTISSLKNYSLRVARSGGEGEHDEDLTTPRGMYGEVARTLLGLLRHCLSPKNIDKNLQLIYSLVYQQAELKSLIDKPTIGSLKTELGRVNKIVQLAGKLVHDNGDARTAPKALMVLKLNMDKLKEASEAIQEADFTFTYEEEADPEVFFVPYIWEVVVCVVTSSTIEWDTSRIQVFPLLDEEEEANSDPVGGEDQRLMQGFANDVSDVV
ncbi:hypothetical protein MHU86_22669 [Fragilaria crotonensis]|nr:hypothetical protein MHU86_22669 [Fragilaria crotonensis]